ncbi:MAG: YceI family protein [Verrucomicrobiota bacterium]
MKNTIKATVISLTAIALQSSLSAAQAFNFEDPKGVNTISFTLDAPLETISGTTNGVTGTVDYDPANPEAMSGTIVVDATSIVVPNPVMLEHLHSEGWINSGEHEEITFDAGSVSNVKKDGDTVTADIKGTFTFHGVSQEITAPLTITYLPGKLKARNGGDVDGDLLVIRSNFEINRSDFGVKPGQATDKVAEDVEVSFALVGYAAS